MKRKKQIRKNFRDAVFKRDGHKCVFCSATEDLDAHHITDRSLMPNGGYVKENGITVCKPCHEECEEYHRTGGAAWKLGKHPDDLYEIIRSSHELALVASENLGDVPSY